MNEIGHCIVSVAPLRKEASDTSEMVNQILFGEKVEVFEKTKKWWQVKLLFDGYTGYIDPKQITIIDIEDEVTPVYTAENYDFGLIDNEIPFPLVLGSELYLKEQTMKVGNSEFFFNGSTVCPNQEKKPLDIALRYLNVPYLWGGKSTFGIDCSGLIQQAFKLCGKKLPRDASKQVESGEVVNFLQEAEAGDLAFFHNEDNKIIHVGILIDNNTILHAHGEVRIDKIDHNGIFNVSRKEYSHQLRVIKRIE